MKVLRDGVAAAVVLWVAAAAYTYVVSGSLTVGVVGASVFVVVFVVAASVAARSRDSQRRKVVDAVQHGSCPDDPVVAREVLVELERRRARYDRQRAAWGRGLVSLLILVLALGFFAVRDIDRHLVAPAVTGFAVIGLFVVLRAFTPKMQGRSISRAEAAGLAASDVLAKTDGTAAGQY